MTVLFNAGLLFWVGITLLLPTLPMYIQYMGGTAQQVGLVMGSFAIGLLCSRTWLGKIADHRGRKLVILLGTVVAAIAPIGYLLVHSIMGLAEIRAFHGVSIAAFSVGYSALVVDLAPRQERGALIGYMNLSAPIGMSIGPGLGGFLQYSGKQYFPNGNGYEVLFLISAICGTLALLLSSEITESVNIQEKLTTDRNDSVTQRNFWQLVGDTALLIPTIVLLLVGLIFGTLAAFLPLFVQELELSFNVGLFYTAAAIASCLVRLFAGKASDRFGRGLFISGSLICYIISMALIAQAQNSTTLMLAAIAEGSGGGILIPLILALISDRSYANERGKVFALCLGGFDLGIAIAGPCSGSLVIFLGYRGVFALAAILAFLALAIFVTQAGRNFSHSLSFALGKTKDIYSLDG